MHFVLSVNVGSSGIKFALFKPQGHHTRETVRGSFKNIGQGSGMFTHVQNGVKSEEELSFKNHTDAILHLTGWIKKSFAAPVYCIAHRLVHGGDHYYQPKFITTGLLEGLKECIPLAPDHLPNALVAIETLALLFPDVPQVACFDTAFHHQLPVVAKTLPLSSNLNRPQLHRYGFHGISYEFITGQLKEVYPDFAHKKIVIAHLGNGASMAAIKNGHSVDTTMGFTPTGGLLMGSRSGDIDPGVLLYLLQQGYTQPQLNDLLNHQSGLKGISGLSSDMQVLLDNQNNPAAKLAVDMFCYQAKKHLGALIAALGGIDVLVFTGGIGEAAAPIRSAICTGMEFAGIIANEQQNQSNSHLISAAGSPVAVHIIKTDEEKQLAQHALNLLKTRA